MPLINTADAIYLGASAADRLYRGATEVWPTASPPSSFATWDPTRPGISGRVTLSNGNKTAALTSDGGTEFGTAVLSNPVDFSSATGRYIEIGVTRGGGGFGGIGPASSGSALNASLGYLGESSVQFCNWQDNSFDSSGEISVNGNRPTWDAHDRLKVFVKGGNYWFGCVGIGWWNPPALAYSGNPDTPTEELLTAFPAGNYSIAVSTVSNATFTVYADPDEWLDTPPAGSNPFTG